MKLKPLPLLVLAALASSSLFAADLPPGEKEAKRAIETSPRHGEYVDVQVPELKKSVRAYVVYPERPERAGVVVVIHEIFGLSDWIKGVTDQLAAEGFIAIAPDLLTLGGKDTDSYPSRDDVTKAVRGLKADEVALALDAARASVIHKSSANGRSGTIGFCWGGGQSFAYAAHQPDVNAAVVYYGTPPSDEGLAKLACPVAGFYGGSDARVTSTVAPTVEKMKKLGGFYTPHVYEGAGHGFLRQQDGQNGANEKATKEAWPATIKFLKEKLK